MAEAFFDLGLNLNATQALNAVASIGKKIDELYIKLNKPVDFDTKPAMDDLKKLSVEAEGIKIGGKGGKIELDTPEISTKNADFGGVGASLAGLVSPAGLATAGIAALGAGLAYAFTVGQEFEQGMAGLGAITGLSGQALDDIGTRAQNLAVKFGGSVSTQIESFQGILSRFGADLAKTPDDLGKVSESVNILAKAGGIDAASAMDTLTGAMLQFGVDTSNSSELASESARFINVMAASARVGAAEIPQVGEAITVAGVAMKKAKVTFEEGNAAIQVLAAGGKFGAEAGTALRNVLGKIAGEEVIPKEALAKMKSLGINMKVVADTSLPLEARLKELGKGAKDATAFTQLFGAENSAAATILASGADTVGKWTAEITGTQDATKQAAINMDTLSERISRGKAAFESFAINTFKVLAPILSGIINVISDAFDKVVNALSPIFEKLKNTFSGAFERIGKILAVVSAFIGGAWLAQITAAFAVIGTIIDVTLNIFNKLFDGIVSAIQPVVDAFKKAFGLDGEAGKSIDVMKIFGDVLTGITDVISFLGDVAVELGGFLVEWIIAPMKVAFTVVSLLIEPLVSFGKHMLGIGETTQSAGGFFSSFIDIVKQAPAFIHAVTAGFKAFVGSITDLITNFSFEKLGKVLKGETFGEAVGSSMGESAAKANNDKLLGGFENSAARLKALAEKVNLSQSEQDKRFNLAGQKLTSEFNKIDFEREKELLLAKSEQQKKAINAKYDKQKDAVTAGYKLEKTRIENEIKAEKEADKVKFQQEKVRIAEAINAKEKAGEIDKKKAEQLRAQILDINLAADKKEESQNNAKTDGAKKEKLKSLKDEIAKTNEETRKLKGESDATLIKDELERALKANEEKFLAAQRSVQKEIADTKAMKDVSNAERIELLKLLETKENLVLENGLNSRDEIIRVHNQKQNAEHAKALEDRNKEVDKINAEQDKKDNEAYRKQLEERVNAELDYAEKHKDIWQKLADSTTDIFKGISDGFTAAFAPNEDVNKEANEAAKKQAEAEIVQLKKDQKAKLVSFSEYQDKLAEIQSRSNDIGTEAGKSFGDKFVDGLNKSLGAVANVFENMGKDVIRQYESDNKEVASINKELEKELILQKELGASDTVEQARDRDKQITKLREKAQKAEIGSLDDMGVVYATFGLTVGASLGAAIAGGTNLFGAVVNGALDAMNALIPVFTVMIMGQELSKLGFAGLVTAGLLMSGLTALVALARSAVQASGFYHGGDTRDTPVGQTAGVVHGQEVIINHEEVKGEFDVFKQVRKTLKSGVAMSDIFGAYQRESLSKTFVGEHGIVTNYEYIPRPVNVNSNVAIIGELQNQTAVLSRKLDTVISATENMPTAFRGNVKHDFEFHHDPSIAVKKAAYDVRRKSLQ